MYSYFKNRRVTSRFNRADDNKRNALIPRNRTHHTISRCSQHYKLWSVRNAKIKTTVKGNRAGHFSPFSNFDILKCSAKVDLENA